MCRFIIEFIARNVDSIIISALGTFIGAIVGFFVTFLVSKFYSQKEQQQLQENAKALFTEIRQVLSEVRQDSISGAVLEHNDRGLPRKKAWGGAEVTTVANIEVEGDKSENLDG